MRITRDQMFMDMLEVAAKRSTCFRGNTAAFIIGPDHNVVSLGYNGPPPGEDHCYGNDCPLLDGGCSRAIHAEINCINRAVDIPDGSVFYTLSAPCVACAAYIGHQREIVRLVYRYPYRVIGGLKHLQLIGLPVQRLTNSGYLIENGVILEQAL